jgi:hypothetical protein
VIGGSGRIRDRTQFRRCLRDSTSYASADGGVPFEQDTIAFSLSPFDDLPNSQSIADDIMEGSKNEQISADSLVPETSVAQVDEVAQSAAVSHPIGPWGPGSAPPLPSVDNSDSQVGCTIEPPLPLQ